MNTTCSATAQTRRILDGVEDKAMSLMTQEGVVRMVWRESFRILEGASGRNPRPNRYLSYGVRQDLGAPRGHY